MCSGEGEGRGEKGSHKFPIVLPGRGQRSYGWNWGKRKRGVCTKRETLERPHPRSCNWESLFCSQDVVDSEERGQEVGTRSYSVPGDPEVLGTAKEDPQVVDTTENSSSIMSFFKTLVSSGHFFFLNFTVPLSNSKNQA